MTLYALIPIPRPEHGAHPASDDRQRMDCMDYFVVRAWSPGRMEAMEGMEDEEASSSSLVAIPRSLAEEEPERACPHAEPEGLPTPADDMPRADLIHLYG